MRTRRGAILAGLLVLTHGAGQSPVQAQESGPIQVQETGPTQVQETARTRARQALPETVFQDLDALATQLGDEGIPADPIFNKALEGYPELQDKPVTALLKNLDAVPEEIRTAVRNNGGGHLNHKMFWLNMSPKGGGEPSGGLEDAIEDAFGSFADFKEEFSKAASTFFGSGWIWLCVNAEGELLVTTTPGHDTPLYEGLFPILPSLGLNVSF